MRCAGPWLQQEICDAQGEGFDKRFVTLIAVETKSVPDILGAKAFLSVLDIRGLVRRNVWQLRANLLLQPSPALSHTFTNKGKNDKI